MPDLGPRPTAMQQRRIAKWERFMQRLAESLRRGPRKPGEAGEAAPVKPDRPLDLSGGAAAALDFED